MNDLIEFLTNIGVWCLSIFASLAVSIIVIMLMFASIKDILDLLKEKKNHDKKNNN